MENPIETNSGFLSLLFAGLLIFNILWIIVASSLLFWKRWKKGVIYPKSSDPDVIFAEKFASGNSHHSFITRRGGASNCLSVFVTETHLALTTFFPFTMVAEMADLEHLIPLRNVLKTTKRDRVIDIEFMREDGSGGKLSLYLRNPETFLSVIESSRTC